MLPSIFDGTMVDLTWPEIQAAADAGAVVLLPTSVLEAHGPHMGIGVDVCCSYLACKLAKENLRSQGIHALIAPPCYWGINTATSAFPGSFTVRKETWQALLYDVLASLGGWGFTRVFNLNWHGDRLHNLAILEVLVEARATLGIDAVAILRAFDAKRFDLTGKEGHVLVRRAETAAPVHPSRLEIHADSLETAIMAHYFPDQVNVALARTLAPTELGVGDLKVWGRGGSDVKAIAPGGYFGDPAAFDPLKARDWMERSGKANADLVASYLGGTYEPPSLP